MRDLKTAPSIVILNTMGDKYLFLKGKLESLEGRIKNQEWQLKTDRDWEDKINQNLNDISEFFTQYGLVVDNYFPGSGTTL